MDKAPIIITQHVRTKALPPRRYNKTRAPSLSRRNERRAAPAKKQCFPRTKTPFYNL